MNKITLDKIVITTKYKYPTFDSDCLFDQGKFYIHSCDYSNFKDFEEKVNDTINNIKILPAICYYDQNHLFCEVDGYYQLLPKPLQYYKNNFSTYGGIVNTNKYFLSISLNSAEYFIEEIKFNISIWLDELRERLSDE